MAEYIERKKLLNELQEEIDFETTMYTEEQNKYFNMGLKCAVRDVKSQPTADVVEVCRCKDCKHVKLDLMEKGLAVCRRAVLKNGQLVPLNLETNYNDFCSYGERKESEVTE